MTKEAIINALTVDMALGCSTNSMLHLPAIAHEVGFDFDISYANPISEKDPEPLSSGTGRSYLYGRSQRGGRCLCCYEKNWQISDFSTQTA